MKVRKPFFAFIILLVLITVFVVFIGSTYLKTNYDRIQERNAPKVEGIKLIIDSLEREFSTELDHYYERLEVMGRLMALMLPEFIENGVYKGPEVFDDGYVVRVENGKIIYPEDLYSQFGLDISMFGSDYTESTAYLPDADGIVSECVISVTKINDAYYYVNITGIDDILKAVFGRIRLEETIQDIESFYGCRLLFVYDSSESETGSGGRAGDIRFIVYPAEAASLDDQPIEIKPEDFGISKDILVKKPSTVTYNNTDYMATYQDISLLGNSGVVIILNTLYDYAISMFSMIIFFTFIIMFIAVSLILWLYWVKKFVRDNKLTSSQVKAYQPKAVRKIVSMVVLVGAIAIFLLANFYQTLNNLNKESLTNQDALNSIMSRLEDTDTNISPIQKDEESWAVYYIEKIASVMGKNKNLRTKEYLEQINQLLGGEYIMLFDSSGTEYASSNAVIGYSLSDTEFLKNYADLLNGLSTYIGDPLEDPNSQRLVQIFGTPVYVDEEEAYNILILANDVENTWIKSNDQSIRDYLENATPLGNLCIVINKDTNEAAFSSDADLTGEKIPGLGYKEGMPAASDLDTYDINNIRYYGCYDSNEKYIVYYLTVERFVRGLSFQFAFASAIGYAAIILIVSWMMLRTYTKEMYDANVKVVESSHLSKFESFDNFWLKNEEANDKNLIERWRTLNPDQKIRIFIQASLSIIACIVLYFTVRANGQVSRITSDFSFRSPINFILFGNWKRGFNLLGFAGILIVILGFVIFVFFKSVFLRVLCKVLNPKGETICRLAFSLLQYAVVIGGIYVMLGFLGFNTTFQLTSVGIVSLAISLGSQDIVADILAGVFIIFEGDFQVGDFIDIDGFSGIVQEIGVRSTKVLGLGDNLKIIGNKNVKNVINKSKMNTWLTLEFKIPSEVPLADVEKLFFENFEGIAERIPEIISGPYYRGVWTINDWGKKILHISCECTEVNARVVTRKLNHEIIMLIESQGYKM